MLPVDESTELITEVLDRCLAGRHRDLYYPEFSAREDTNNNNTMDEMPIKKVSKYFIETVTFCCRLCTVIIARFHVSYVIGYKHLQFVGEIK